MPDIKTLTASAPLCFTTFPRWAEQFVREMELTLLEKEQGADYWRWLLDFEGAHLLLCFEHYGACAWLQPFSDSDQETALWLTEQWNRP